MAVNESDSESDGEKLASDDSSSCESDVDSDTESLWGFPEAAMVLGAPMALGNPVGDTSPDGAIAFDAAREDLTVIFNYFYYIIY